MHENKFSASSVIACWQTDTHDEGNGLILNLLFVNTPKHDVSMKLAF
jgi:hypothetical protein